MMKASLIATLLLQALAVYSVLDGADAASEAKVICGGGSKSKKCLSKPPKMADKEEKYGARCCSQTPFFNSEHKTKNGCSNYAGTITNIFSAGVGTTSVDGLYCPWSLTYAEAETYCSNLGVSLCTEAEIEGKCAKASGCHLNWEYIWALDPTTEAPTAAPTATPTKSPTPKLTSILIYGGTHVDTFYFEYNNGESTKKYGNNGGGNRQTQFYLQADEYLVRIWGYDYSGGGQYGGYMGYQINFVTSKGRTYKYGTNTAGKYYNFEKTSGQGITDCEVYNISGVEYEILSVS